LGQALGGGNTFARLAENTALQTVSSLLAGKLGSLVGVGPALPPDPIAKAALDALNDVSPALASAFQTLGPAAFGSLSGFLAGELAEGLGLNGTSFGDQLFRSVTGSLLTTVLRNITNIALSSAELTTQSLFAG